LAPLGSGTLGPGEILIKATGSPYAEWEDEEGELEEEDEAEDDGALDDPADLLDDDEAVAEDSPESGEPRAHQAGEAVEARSADPFAMPEYAAICGEAQDYLRSVFSGDRPGRTRPPAMGRDPP